jgi:alkylresorcinol/alkylpyrone synthase
MGFPHNIKRTPIFGLGCVAGAAGIARAADYVRAFPKQYALLLSVELVRSPGNKTIIGWRI